MILNLVSSNIETQIRDVLLERFAEFSGRERFVRAREITEDSQEALLQVTNPQRRPLDGFFPQPHSFVRFAIYAIRVRVKMILDLPPSNIETQICDVFLERFAEFSARERFVRAREITEDVQEALLQVANPEDS